MIGGRRVYRVKTAGPAESERAGGAHAQSIDSALRTAQRPSLPGTRRAQRARPAACT